MEKLDDLKKKGRVKTEKPLEIKKKRKAKYWYEDEETGKRTYVRYKYELPKEEQKKRKSKVKSPSIKTKKAKVKKERTRKPKVEKQKKPREPWSEERRKAQGERVRKWWKEHPEAKEKTRERIKEYWKKAGEERRKAQGERVRKWWKEHPEAKEKARERIKEYWKKRKELPPEQQPKRKTKPRKPKVKKPKKKKPWTKKRRKEHAKKLRKWWEEHPEAKEKARQRAKDYWKKKKEKEPVPSQKEPVSWSNIDAARSEIDRLPYTIYTNGQEFIVEDVIFELYATIDGCIEKWGEEKYDSALGKYIPDISRLVSEYLKDPSDLELFYANTSRIKTLLECHDMDDLSMEENIERTMEQIEEQKAYENSNKDEFSWMNDVEDFNLLE